ncbi:hypothetical protein SEMRO_1071_G237990.1 [Seminavis robusta]|uniref:Uncharacterized protein n=1 Tax=Seminavis robusta TaxID=568900 RepID=A0A9N8HRG3_9STRA|nr:hypothetical protein SEMRO_1071_G237990.1 [Seminavis robusta]|eukprot:Sro1071_g237990.1 n/a (362) ;mRNA; f:31771-33186
MSSSYVWVQLYYKHEGREDLELKGGRFDIGIADIKNGNISGLTKKVKEERQVALSHCDAADLSVYPDGTTSFSQDNAVDPGGDVSPDTTSKHPLIVVASAPKQADASGVSADQISSLVAFAQEELDNRTKHKAISEASVQFAASILAGNGIQTVVEDPIREAGSLVHPPKFSWEVSEHAGTPGVMKWANEHLLAGEKEYGLKVVTGAMFPKVKGNRKSTAGKGDIAIGKLENMEFYDHGGKAWEDFMKLIKSAEIRQLQNPPPPSLAAIKEDNKGEEDEQNLDGFAIPAHEKKRQRALDDQAMLERMADHLGELYGERLQLSRRGLMLKQGFLTTISRIMKVLTEHAYYGKVLVSILWYQT